jgi:hypothetical protein
MVTLSLKDSGSVVGSISDADFQLLVDQLEEESEEDTDYYVSAVTIEMLEQRGAGPNLVGVLKRAVGGSEGVDVVWKRS